MNLFGGERQDQPEQPTACLKGVPGGGEGGIWARAWEATRITFPAPASIPRSNTHQAALNGGSFTVRSLAPVHQAPPQGHAETAAVYSPCLHLKRTSPVRFQSAA